MSLIYLIGGRGAGKTTLGRALSANHGFEFADLDEELCNDMGMDVAQIVEARGWDGFRDEEGRVLRELTKKFLDHAGHVVLGCGGGIVERRDNMAFLRENGLVIWLDPPLATQIERLAKDAHPGQRPSLTGRAMLAELDEIMRRRKPLYAECAHLRLDSALGQDKLCQSIAEFCDLRKENGHKCAKKRIDRK